MRNRQLSRQEALEEYLIYQIRLFDYLHMFQIVQDIIDGRYKPSNQLRHGENEFLDTVRAATYGLFASLIDPQSHALNVFDVWQVLFPEEEKRIAETWDNIRPYLQSIRDYRNDVACHVNKDLRRYFETRSNFRHHVKEIVAAMREFWELAAELMKKQAVAVPDLRNEIDPILHKASPTSTPEELEKLKDFLLLK